MNKTMKIIIVITLIVAVSVVIALKQNAKTTASEPIGTTNSNPASVQTASENIEASTKNKSGIPRLVDLGADKCIPCKMMSPILEELKKEFTGSLEVKFIDVWKNPNAGRDYVIRIIPTQIFYDRSGKELFRHEGFFSKEDILNKWKEFGINLEKGTNNKTK